MGGLDKDLTWIRNLQAVHESSSLCMRAVLSRMAFVVFLVSLTLFSPGVDSVQIKQLLYFEPVGNQVTF